jgi:alcohol dehydrogenase (cytochrome c)
MTTGQTTTFYNGKAPSNGAILSTAGGLVFCSDLDRHFFAFDADTEKILRQTTLDAPIQNSTITYAVNGKQYIAVLGGLGELSSGLLRQAELQPVQKNGLYVLYRNSFCYSISDHDDYHTTRICLDSSRAGSQGAIGFCCNQSR